MCVHDYKWDFHLPEIDKKNWIPQISHLVEMGKFKHLVKYLIICIVHFSGTHLIFAKKKRLGNEIDIAGSVVSAQLQGSCFNAELGSV